MLWHGLLLLGSLPWICLAYLLPSLVLWFSACHSFTTLPRPCSHHSLLPALLYVPPYAMQLRAAATTAHTAIPAPILPSRDGFFCHGSIFGSPSPLYASMPYQRRSQHCATSCLLLNSIPEMPFPSSLTFFQHIAFCNQITCTLHLVLKNVAFLRLYSCLLAGSMLWQQHWISRSTRLTCHPTTTFLPSMSCRLILGLGRCCAKVPCGSGLTSNSHPTIQATTFWLPAVSSNNLPYLDTLFLLPYTF